MKHESQRQRRSTPRGRYKRWAKANPEKINEYSNQRRVRKMGAEGSHTLGEWLLLLSIYDGKCAYKVKCDGAPATTRDHIMPLTKDGTDNIDNIVPACAPCNSSKGDKYLWEWSR